MLARLASASIRGLDAEAVDIEVDLSRGLPAWNMVGLAEAAVREARERVRSAVTNSGFEFPLRRITVNLAPADRKKDGSCTETQCDKGKGNGDRDRKRDGSCLSTSSQLAKGCKGDCDRDRDRKKDGSC